MYHTLKEFTDEYKMESQSTLKLLKVLTTESLYKTVDGKVRSIGRLSYHLAHTVAEMMGKTGLNISCDIKNPSEDTTVTAEQIVAAYLNAVNQFLAEIETKWTDASLQQTNNMYGQDWSVALTLSILLKHEIHHRGQLTVLMRLAGLVVPGVYGPSAEEWEQYGMKQEE
jgi:uncharacterized damage-inducible protein DinB